MKPIAEYLDSTFLTPREEYEGDYESKIQSLVDDEPLLVMVLSEFVPVVRRLCRKLKVPPRVGTVIDFPKGSGGLTVKIDEIQTAIERGADEIDIVVDYKAYLRGDVAKVHNEVNECLLLVKDRAPHVAVKWIIETDALTQVAKIGLCKLIRNAVEEYAKDLTVFLKTSTGFYDGGEKRGATVADVQLMKQEGSPLLVKASGGIRDYESAIRLIEAGASRIGTSKAKEIVLGEEALQNRRMK